MWRFPFTAYKFGGAFIIPYTIMFELVGKPIYFLEMAIGQFTSKGSVNALSIFPAMRGVAVGQQVAATFVVTYYCSLITLALFYMSHSFASKLPWADCKPEWTDNSTECVPSYLYPFIREYDPDLEPDFICSAELYYV